MTPQRKTVFISYSHADEKRPWLKRLQVHLKRLESQSSVERWDDTRIPAGADWRKDIEHALKTAVAAVLLVTEDFLASDFICKYELPALLKAAKKKGTVIIPVIAAPCSYAEHPNLSELQAINSPRRTLTGMQRGEQEELWTKVVKQVEEKLAEAGKRVREPSRRKKPAGRASSLPLVRVGLIPTIGRFFGRGQQIEKIRSFLKGDSHNIAIIQGFYGIGKTAFAAKLVNLAGDDFDGVFWLTCHADESSADVLLSALAAFFGDHGDRSLRDIWNDPDPKRFRLKIERLILSLRAKRYLLVFDGFEEWLNSDFQVRNESMRKVLAAILHAAHPGKTMLISRKRPLFDPAVDAVPLGSWIEETIPGLDLPDAIALLRCSGLNLDETLLGKLADQYAGNPQLLQIVSYQIHGLHRDPEELLQSADANDRPGKLLGSVFEDLSKESRDALELLAVFRRPLTRAQLSEVGFRFDTAIGPLLNRFLVQENEGSKLVAMDGLVRKSVLASLVPERRIDLHQQAAESCKKFAGALNGESDRERVQFALEEAFHRRENGDFVSAARAIAGIAGLLIDRGYVDQAQENLDLVLANPADDYSRARAFAGLGRIGDLRGKYDAALAHLNSALALFETTAEYAGIAESLYRIGRIHNARGDFGDAETCLRKCIAVCEKHGTTAGLAGAELALGWNQQQRGKPLEGVERYYGLAIQHAEEAKDWTVLCGACRNMGFLLWVWDKKRDQRKSREAYARASEVAKKHDIAKELNAVETDLAYLSTEWGDPKAGEDLARSAIDSCTKLGNKYGLANAYCNLGKALEAQARWPDAASAYDEGRRLSAAVRNFGGEVFAERHLARLHHRAGESSEAQSVLRKAIVRLRGRDMPKLLAKLKKELQEMKN
jgi:tetratricopeptide (TPR) repeat protein